LAGRHDIALILRELPFFDEITTIHAQGQVYSILQLQIIVWVSLGPHGLQDLHPLAPRIPAVLDPAFTGTFLIHEQQLRQLAGSQPEHLRELNSSFLTHERRIPIHGGNVWLHRNQPGQRDKFLNAAPVLLELHRGLGITTGADVYPRLPLLGARALRGANLQVHIDYSRCRVNVRTPRWYWPFG
jgi:hypothetical protein